MLNRRRIPDLKTAWTTALSSPMKKTVVVAAVFTAVLGAAAAFTAVTAFAEDRQGVSGWQVTFDGKNMESNFTSSDISDEAIAMQPGDSVELTITLKNNYDGEVDWYMKNEVLEALEDAGKSEGGAYDYLLTYTDTKGELSTLYSSEKFGGEGRIGGVGLHGAANTLEDYFYLDRMGKGETGVVKLKVALDGETLVNDYQNTLAKLQMDFATELAGSEGQRQRLVKTGDESKTLLFVILLFVSGMGLLIGAMFMLRDSQRKKETAEEAKVRRR